MIIYLPSLGFPSHGIQVHCAFILLVILMAVHERWQ